MAELRTPVWPLEANEVKQRINSKILESFHELELKPELCRNSSAGKRDALTIESLNEETKVSVTRAGEATLVSFTVTGNNFFHSSPCAEIKVGKAVSMFELPTGYTATALAVTP